MNKKFVGSKHYVVSGSSGSGKSSYLVKVAINQLYDGKSVVFVIIDSTPKAIIEHFVKRGIDVEAFKDQLQFITCPITKSFDEFMESVSTVKSDVWIFDFMLNNTTKLNTVLYLSESIVYIEQQSKRDDSVNKPYVVINPLIDDFNSVFNNV